MYLKETQEEVPGMPAPNICDPGPRVEMEAHIPYD